MIINQVRLDSELPLLKKKYVERSPFPNIVIEDFLKASSIEQINKDFPSVSDEIWTHYVHYNEQKHGLTKWEHFPLSIQELIMEMSAPPFVSWLENLTGINGLFADPELEGSGLHQTLKGGFLNIHADFSAHPKNKNWHRRVNVLVYVNECWQEEWGGYLELWDEGMSKCVKKIAPSNNRVAIFGTGSKTFHGYPNPLNCPEDYPRKSVAMYFYTKGAVFEKVATGYQARPSDGKKKFFIWADNRLISIYSSLKSYFGLNDDFISGILNRFSKK